MRYNNAIIVPGGRKVTSREPIDDRIVAINRDDILQAISEGDPFIWYRSLSVYVEEQNADYLWLNINELPVLVDPSTALLDNPYTYPANDPVYPSQEFNFFAKAGQGGGGSGDGDMKKSIYDTNNNGKVDVAEMAELVEWFNVSSKPDFDAIYAPLVHTHTINDIANLQVVLDGKANAVHTHVIADILNLQAELDNRYPTDDTKTDVNHTLSASKIISLISNAGGGDMTKVEYDTNLEGGKVDVAKLAEAVDYNNISNLPVYFPVDPQDPQLDTRYYERSLADLTFAPTAHTHVPDDITGLTSLLQSFANYEVKESSFTAEAGKGYILIAQSNAINVTLPANNDGSRVDILALDLTNAVSIVPQSGNIGGGSSYSITTINSVYQPFYSTFEGQWKVLTESGGTGGIGDAPDGDPHYRVQNNWVKSLLILKALQLPSSGNKGYVWNSTTLEWEEQAASQNAVTSVNGETGAVVLDTGDVAEVTDKNYVTDTEKAAITTNTAALDTKVPIIFPDPAIQLGQYKFAPVTKAWFDAQNPNSLDPDAEYFQIDNGSVKLKDTSGAVYTLQDEDQNVFINSEDNFTLAAGVITAGEGYMVTLINKSSTSNIELNTSAVSVVNRTGNAVNIPADGGSIRIIKINNQDNYLII